MNRVIFFQQIFSTKGPIEILHLRFIFLPVCFFFFFFFFGGEGGLSLDVKPKLTMCTASVCRLSGIF